MISPADEPSVAVISGNGVNIRLEKHALPSASDGDLLAAARGTRNADREPTAVGSGRSEIRDRTSRIETSASAGRAGAGGVPIVTFADDAKWVTGRAGMEYRDLVPGRLGGRLIVSHIRLSASGEVDDYVHYHKLRFQMIYCWHGKVKVIYEDQGDAFWMHPGDCVLQPPEIRHRVLESSAGAQVIEFTSPASHETWTDREIKLPTGRFDPERDFSGQRFVLHRAAQSTPTLGEYGDFEAHHFGIHAASNGACRVLELRTQKDHSTAHVAAESEAATFYFILSGRVSVAVSAEFEHRLTAGDSITLPTAAAHTLNAAANSEILAVIV